MSTSESLLKEISQQLLTCKLCGERLKRPKTLSCLHSFCSKCLRNHQSKSTVPTLCCPICRSRTPLPGTGITNLPDNLLLTNLADILEKQRTENGCGICQLSQAVSKCLDCSKLLCKNCVTRHRLTKVTSQHTIHKLGENVLCNVHCEENVRFYCDNCQICVCILCTFEQHQNHEVTNLSATIAKNVPVFHQLLTDCRSKVNLLEEKVCNMKRVENKIRLAEESVQDKAFEMIASIRQQQKKLTAKLHQISSPFHLNKEQEAAQETINSLIRNAQSIDQLLQSCGVELLLLKDELQTGTRALLDYECGGCSNDDDNKKIDDDIEMNIRFYPGQAFLGEIGRPIINSVSQQTDYSSLIIKKNELKAAEREPSLLRDDSLLIDEKPHKLLQTSDKCVSVNRHSFNRSNSTQTELSFNAVLMQRKYPKKTELSIQSTIFHFTDTVSQLDTVDGSLISERIEPFKNLNLKETINVFKAPKLLKDVSVGTTNLRQLEVVLKQTPPTSHMPKTPINKKSSTTTTNTTKTTTDKRPPLPQILTSSIKRPKASFVGNLRRPNSLGTIRELKENSSSGGDDDDDDDDNSGHNKGKPRRLRSARTLYKAEPSRKCENILLETPFGKRTKSTSISSLSEYRRTSLSALIEENKTTCKSSSLKEKNDMSTNTDIKLTTRATNTDSNKDSRVVQCITKLTKVQQRLENTRNNGSSTNNNNNTTTITTNSGSSSSSSGSGSSTFANNTMEISDSNSEKMKSSSEISESTSSPFTSPVVLRRRSKSQPDDRKVDYVVNKARKKRVDFNDMLAKEKDKKTWR